MPEAGNPQALNRYAYVYNSPLNYIDPGGHDPLNADWQAAFKAAHGRDPGPYDIAIRLFSLAFPDEWDWNRFYNPDGSLNYEGFVSVFTTPGANRNWFNMPNALARLASNYTLWETSCFVQDVGTLFAGLADRIHFPGALTALSGQQIQLNAHIGGYGSSPEWNSGSDADANVHHWAAYFVLGYYSTYPVGIGPLGSLNITGISTAMTVNVGRELLQVRTNGYLARDDIVIGNRAVGVGAGLRSLNLISPAIIRFWYYRTMLPPIT